MSDSIGSLAVTLALDAVAFTSGMDKATKDAGSFASGLTKTFAGISAGLAVGGAGLGIAEGAFSWVKKGIDDVADVGREAQKLGTSTAFLSSLQFEAGRASEGLGHALNHLNVQLAEVGQGSTEAAMKFQKLGLDGKQLASLGLEGAWKKISDRMAGMADATQRAGLAHELFGREAGAALIPVLSKGTAGLLEAEAAAKKFGLSVSSIDAGRALVAQRAMDDLGKSFEGIQRTFAIEFAPLIADVANGVSNMVAKAGGGKAIFHELAIEARTLAVTMLKGVEDIGVGLADFAQKIDKITHATENLATKLKLFAVGPLGTKAGGKAIDFAKEVVSPGWGINGGLKPDTAWGKGLKDTLDPLIKGIKDGASDDKIGKMIADLEKLGKGGAIADPMKNLTDGIGKLELKLADEAAAFGLSGAAAERHKLMMEGATAAQLANVDSWVKTLDAMKQSADAMKHLSDVAAKVSADTASPFDKFKTEADDLNKALGAGKIDKDQRALGLAKDFGSLGGLHDAYHPVGAALEGSTQAYSAVAKFQSQTAGGDVQERLAKLAEDAKQDRKKLIDIGNKIAEWMDRVNVAG